MGVPMKNVERHLQKKCAYAAFCLGLGWAGVVSAQALPDPTRPPNGFVDPADLKGGPAPGASPLPGATDKPPEMVLQSVLLPKKGKPVAVISGAYLPLGGKLEGWELKSVHENEVVLEQGKERRVLRLTPQVRKTMVANADAASSPTIKKVAGKPASQKQKKSKTRKVS